MQDLGNYEHGIHTRGQAVNKFTSCCGDVTYRIGFRVLTSFLTTTSFIVAILSSNLIMAMIDGGAFNTTQFAVIMVFIFTTVIIAYMKEAYESTHQHRHDFVVAPAIEQTAANYSHTFYQK
jgi:hypothetical protein